MPRFELIISESFASYPRLNITNHVPDGSHSRQLASDFCPGIVNHDAASGTSARTSSCLFQLHHHYGLFKYGLQEESATQRSIVCCSRPPRAWILYCKRQRGLNHPKGSSKRTSTWPLGRVSPLWSPCQHVLCGPCSTYQLDVHDSSRASKKVGDDP